MRNFVSVFVYLCLIPVSAIGDELPADYEKNWPQWRGPDANGVAPRGNPPVKWDENKNIKWKIEIPGKGHATPIVWDNQVFVLTAIETDEQVESQKEEQTQGQRRRGPPIAQTSYVHKFAILAIKDSSKYKYNKPRSLSG